MKTTNFKGIVRAGAVVLLSANLLVPTSVSAQGADPEARRREAGENRAEVQAGRVCERIIALSERMKERLGSRGEALASRHEEQGRKREERTSGREERILENRRRWEARRGNLYVRLDGLVSGEGDSTKSLSVLFKRAVDEAVRTRQDAVDSANGVYHASLAALLDERAGVVEEAKGSYRDGMISALDASITACNGGEDPVSAREALRSALDAAKRDFLSARERIDTFRDAHREIVENRKAALLEAQEAFRDALEAAREEFVREAEGS